MEQREGNSPSWFNLDEVFKVLVVVEQLDALGYDASDIGVITPYAKQRERLKHALKCLGSNPTVGTVEQFQGQERRVIIISTVRSSLEFEAHDIAHNLGFVKSPKRFNVAITRAKSLLIVIGNPSTLMSNEYWKEVLQYSVANNSYIGPRLTMLDDDEEEAADEKEEQEEDFEFVNLEDDIITF